MAIRRRNRNFRAPDPADAYRTNRQIRSQDIRLVGDNFDQISEVAGNEIKPGETYNTRNALRWAEELDMDLVVISPKADPPVAKIVNFKKFLYNKKKKDKELKAKQVKTVVKEIRFGPNTDDHDFDFKVRHAKNFLEEGNKVRAYVHFRGRTIVFKDRGELLLLRLLKELEDYGNAETLPKLEGRKMTVIVSPKKVKKKK